MFCEKCGREVNPNSKFCEACGNRIGTPQKRKNVYIALILSLILSGLGTIYAGYTKKGLILAALRLIFAVIGWYVPLFSVLTLIVFIYGFYDAYCEVQYANGVKKRYPLIFNKDSSQSKLIIIIVFFILIVVGISMIMSLTSNSYHSTSTHTSPHTSTHRSTGSSSGGSHYRGVDDSPSTIARNDPDWYYDHYEYGDNNKIDDYLESQGFG